MDNRELLTSLTKLGLSMFEPSDEPDVNETLSEVVKRHDTRLWEGFPVLLANATENYQFAPEEVKKRLTQKKQQDHFYKLMLLSGSMFSFYHLSFSWWNKTQKGLPEKDKALVKKWRNHLAHNKTLKFNDAELDPERLKGMFELYYEKRAEKNRRTKEKVVEYSLENALSQVFSPKQKELFKKKLEGLPLNKTEQEYYSRTVKKKVVALANSELHSLSKKLLEL